MTINILPTYMQSRLSSILGNDFNTYCISEDTCFNGINSEQSKVSLSSKVSELIGNRKYLYENSGITYSILLDPNNIQPAIYQMVEIYVTSVKEEVDDEDEIIDLLICTLTAVIVNLEEGTIDIIINE